MIHSNTITNPPLIAEICCGSYYDAMQALEGGAGRIELNCALALGGLTPTTATLRMVKEKAPDLQVIAMLRPRGAFFNNGTVDSYGR